MIIKLKNKTDFNHAVTYLRTQSYCFDKYDSSNMIRFPQDLRGHHALEDLNISGVQAESVSYDLLPALA